MRIRSAQISQNHNQIGYAWYPRGDVASFPRWKVIWGHIMTSSGRIYFLPISFDRNELETWGWCHIVRLVKVHRLTCNMTFLDHTVALTRAWPGGGRLTPPSRIFTIAQKRTALSTWNLAGLLIQQFDIVRGNFFEIRRKFFEIWSILWRHYTPLLVENWPNFAGLWKTQFLMKTQMKNTKRRKMRSSTR